MIKSDLSISQLTHIVRHASIPCQQEARALYDAASPDDLAWQMSKGRGPLKWVFSQDGEPIVALGVTEVRAGDPTVWQTWMIHTDQFGAIIRGVSRFIGRELIPALQNVGAHRCQTRSLASNSFAHRWFTGMGAVEESTLFRYGRHGEDFKMFRWDRHDVR